MILNGYSIEVRETLRFKPPQRKKKGDPKLNLVQPNTNEKTPLDQQMAFSSGDEEACKRSQNRRAEVGTFERS